VSVNNAIPSAGIVSGVIKEAQIFVMNSIFGMLNGGHRIENLCVHTFSFSCHFVNS